MAGPGIACPTRPCAGGITYQQSWYVGSSWQAAATGVRDTTYGTGDVPLLRVVVAVTWAGAGCPAGACSDVRSTLVSPAGDPVFIAGR